ncbi:MAG: YraN family protein, partial [Mariprofundaceae bacterium]
AKGRSGEERACRYLRHRGYTILSRNIRLARGELDIVARHRDLLVFVEVKAHQTRESGLLAVNEDKCARLQSAALAWLGQHPELGDLQCRFDLIILTPRMAGPGWLPPHIEHMKDIIR